MGKKTEKAATRWAAASSPKERKEALRAISAAQAEERREEEAETQALAEQIRQELND